jgi:hypothetical protein
VEEPMGEMSRHQQSKSEGCRRHDRAGHEKFMPQIECVVAQHRPLRAAASVIATVNDTRSPSFSAACANLHVTAARRRDGRHMLQHATLPEISYSSPEVLDFLCAYFDRATRNHSA